MTERDDRVLDDATLRALRENDELLPTTEAEVARAERSLPDVELPSRLQQYRPRTAHPDSARRLPSKGGYVLAAVAGALAAAAALLLWFQRPSPIPVTSAGGELVRPSASGKPGPVPLVFQSKCEQECCAGSDCKRATPALNACPSGIRCATCAADNVSGGPYRLRLGTVITSEAGQKLLPRSTPLELCVVPAAGEAQCVPALAEENGASWRLLKAVTPLQDLLLGLDVQLRQRGEPTPLASWKHAVSPTADVMCKGLAVTLSNGTDTLGRLSAFIEPTHFVELSRASTVPELLQAARRFDVSGATPRIHESSQSGGNRFALVLGPFDKPDAEALRWQVLDHGLDANISQGLDYIGTPRPLR